MTEKERTRFEINLNDTPRDRRLAEWIDWQITQGRNVAELIKNVMDEMITGKSSLTGRAIVYQGDMPVMPSDPDDPIAQRLMAMPD